ncbi:hypothetical protein MHB48_10930 [Psychrobacillus sp. FSL H8-0483]|uniref:hypothetical protein n=1 Tax=Psychrobacillus sp. FSL H8-0483 TaxID=2921389 RepID=UPI00315A1BE9
MKQLLNLIDYLKCGKETFPTQSYIDDQQMPADEKKKLTGITYVELNFANIANDLAFALERCEKEKRSLCFYMNGAKNKKDIKRIRFFSVDVDEKGGTKEEQYERIKSAPLQPTLVWRGRAGHKLLYEVEEAEWDISTNEKLEQSVIQFKNVQQQLIEFFNGDERKVSPNDCFRLPLTNNYKEYTEKGIVYREEIVLWEPSNVYTQKQLSEAFPLAKKKHEKKESFTVDIDSQDVLDIIECFIDCLESEDLIDVVTDEKVSFKCPIHNDNSPSGFLFYNRLICHCSSNNCPVENGKPLSWVAKEKGWKDLEEVCVKLEAKPAEKYEQISLSDMQSNELVPLQPTNAIAKGNVKGVLSKVVDTMTKLRIPIDATTTNVYANIINELDLQVEGITVCPLEPGGGKSTIMGAYLKYMLEHSIPESGTIIVVERTETAKKLMKELGKYTIFVDADGKAIDAPYYESSPAAFVMESAYTYKDCKQKLEKYQYGVCRECPFKGDCIVYNKHQEQKNYPVVIMTHARLKMEADGLSKYSRWQCKDGNEYERKRIIIDEKPPLVDVTTIQRTDLDQFLFDVRTMTMDIGKLVVDETKVLIDQLREQLLDASSGKKIVPINPDFVFPYSKTWYRKYSGDNVNLLRDIEYLIQQGGLVKKTLLNNFYDIRFAKQCDHT